ncbi:hypothetical protein ACER0A_012060 [Haloimpatiens sp. FM7315]|uniref:EamA family transporter n=1 Tax=Haloimpatiens sp. FM7315 TaxID=3298609 RepID=UPI0035A38F08
MIKYKEVDYKNLFCLFTTSLGLVLVVFKGTINLNWMGVSLAVISCISYSYFCIGLNDKKIGISTSVIISTFEPIFVCILGFVFFNEIITTNMVIGGFIIILSLILLQIPIKNIFKAKIP